MADANDLDVILALASFLEADSNVFVKASTRIFPAELPEKEIKKMPRHAIVLRSLAGGAGPGGTLELEGVIVDVISYGKTMEKAAALRWNTYRALKHMERVIYNSVLLHSADRISAPESLRDVETNWPACRETWEILASELTAS